METSKAVAIATIFAVTLLVLGLTHIVYANKIVRFYRRLYPPDRFPKILFPFRLWMESRDYEIWMRVFGGLSIAMGILLIVVMVRGVLGG